MNHKKPFALEFDLEDIGWILDSLRLARGITLGYGRIADPARQRIIEKTTQLMAVLPVSRQVVDLMPNEFAWFNAVTSVREGAEWSVKVEDWPWRYAVELIVGEHHYKLAGIGSKKEVVEPLVEELKTFLTMCGPTKGDIS